MVVDKHFFEILLFKRNYHLGIGLPLLASEVDEGSDLVDGAVGQCNRVDHMVGNWGNCVVDKGGRCVVDNGGNVMEDRVGDNLVAHLFEMLSKIILVVIFLFDSPQQAPQRQT